MGILHWFRFDNDYWDPGLHALGLVVASYYPPGVDGIETPVLYDGVVKATAIRTGW